MVAATGRWAVPAALVPLWLLCLATQRAYGQWCLRTGHGEFRRVLRAAGLAVVLSAAAWWFAPHEGLLHDALLALPVAAVLTIALRRLLRRRLRAARRRSGQARRVLVAGPTTACAELSALLTRGAVHEFEVMGTCLPGNLPSAVSRRACDAVIAVPGPGLDAAELRRLTWDLQARGVELLLAPVPADVAAARLAVQPVAGIPLLRLEAPRISHTARIPEEALDRLAAGLGLLALAPLLLVIALVVRLDSPGPAIFTQRRIGRDGREFTLLKFRTMYRDAEQRKAELAALNQYGGDGAFFKIADDPRVTRVGSFLRHYSLDELPQLFNVLTGRMALVGPRPLPRDELLALDPQVRRRRLLVKPGLTGLWQVSGRSEVAAQERVQLDLDYVENWSPALDLEILARTPSVVIHGTGAY
ncbi:exopolysaccharide biosynthesis polyprenyl glycosylphosphotransferase [Kitasatospora sp. NPDC127111]|uniref:exopolysaccharide biosynthesis polyprenyl glycosylphosphotransferase n=1 Tax=Kitasatospora sp. NPDC127111 TaxID=3345363 RepID=UPI0036441CE9